MSTGGGTSRWKVEDNRIGLHKHLKARHGFERLDALTDTSVGKSARTSFWMSRIAPQGCSAALSWDLGVMASNPLLAQEPVKAVGHLVVWVLMPLST